MSLKEARKHEYKKYEYLYRKGELCGNSGTIKPYGKKCWGKGALPLLMEIKPKSILDIGCGTNTFCTNVIKKSSLNCICKGVDFAGLLANFKAPAHKIPVPNKSFEWITAFDIMEHLLPEEVDEVFEEFYRIATNGWLFSIAYIKSKRTVFGGEQLHMTIRPKEWWVKKIKKYIEVKEFVGVFRKPSNVKGTDNKHLVKYLWGYYKK